jgi:hypothetical protein
MKEKLPLLILVRKTLLSGIKVTSEPHTMREKEKAGEATAVVVFAGCGNGA